MNRAPKDRPRILLVAPATPERAALEQVLSEQGYPVVPVGTLDGALEQAGGPDCDLVLLDRDLSVGEASHWLARAQETTRPASVILIGERPTPEEAIEVLRAGVFDFLFKPVSSQRLLEAVEQAIENRRSFVQIMSLSERLKEANQALGEQNESLERERDLLMKRNHDLGVLNKIGQGLLGTLHADEIVNGAISKATDLVPYDLLALAWVHGDRVWGHASRPGEHGVLGAYQQTTQERARLLAAQHPRRVRQTILREDRREIEISLNVSGRRMGLLRIMRYPGRPGFDAYEIEVLSALANSLALALRGADAHHEAESLAVTDALTNLLNRRAFTNALDREFKRAVRYAQPLGLLMIDIDHFKEINDRFGHQAGDSVLRQVAAFVGQSIRTVDAAARYGGDEFAVIMPGTAWGQALYAAERIRQLVWGHTFLPECRDYRVTVSIGVAQYKGQTATTPDDLVRDADLALYQAKTGGRNGIKVAGFPGVALHLAASSAQSLSR
jgi:diguanylate cyclase (GGDEF)-like protein